MVDHEASANEMGREPCQGNKEESKKPIKKPK
jgi:hypothetical protein